ncbi:hypothetical protein NDU88_005992 [Pleurodeles waltl]|uniref:Uncharacterized protein n=1 Tax=Pleurodeles waltl TaxID=8319 RepID=A0AAV7PH13_PLEWA|nr:hypothetical protein NDU88_005992 [Pleurodeles waltl]
MESPSPAAVLRFILHLSTVKFAAPQQKTTKGPPCGESAASTRRGGRRLRLAVALREMFSKRLRSRGLLRGTASRW